MTDNPAESGLMRATAKNIEGLQRAVKDLQVAAAAANADAQAAKKAAAEARAEARRWKILTRVLGFFVVACLVASGLSTYNWIKQKETTNQIRQQVITGCEHGNSTRYAETMIWNHILNEFLVGTTTEPPAERQATIAFVQETEHYVAVHLAPRSCE